MQIHPSGALKSSPMRIMLVIRSLGVGGAERQLAVLASGLRQHGHSVKVVVFYGGGDFESELMGNNIPLVSLERKGRWDLIPFFFRLRSLIKRENPDVIYSYMQVANIWAVLAKMTLPRIKVVWGILASNVDMSQYSTATYLTDKFEALLSRFPDWTLCNSQAGLIHVINKGFPPKRTSVVPSGMDTDQFFPDPGARRLLRKVWQVGDHQKLIGIVGRLDPIKDHVNFLKAAALLLEERSNVCFVCVGVGQEDALEVHQKLASSLGLDGHLIWAGKQDEMRGVYNALDVLVSSSRSEGLSNVAAEAMACGTPCVVTDVGDSKRIVGDCGEAVAPQDALALKTGMARMLERIDQRDIDLAAQCRQRIVENFSSKKMICETIESLEKVI